MTEYNKLYKNIRKLREKRGWTQERLAQELYVNPQSVKGWESLIEKYRTEPKLSHLMKMCKIFDCDLDYLVGTMQERTHDLKTASELTGLSEAALEKIVNPDLDHPFAKTLSHLIESESFYNLITTYKIFLVSAEKLGAADIDEPPYELDDGDKVTLSCNEATHHFMSRVSNAMTHVCEEDYYKYLDEASKKAQENKLNHIESIVKEFREKRGKE